MAQKVKHKLKNLHLKPQKAYLQNPENPDKMNNTNRATGIPKLVLLCIINRQTGNFYPVLCGQTNMSNPRGSIEQHCLTSTLQRREYQKNFTSPAASGIYTMPDTARSVLYNPDLKKNFTRSDSNIILYMSFNKYFIY